MNGELPFINLHFLNQIVVIVIDASCIGCLWSEGQTPLSSGIPSSTNSLTTIEPQTASAAFLKCTLLFLWYTKIPLKLLHTHCCCCASVVLWASSHHKYHNISIKESYWQRNCSLCLAAIGLWKSSSWSSRLMPHSLGILYPKVKSWNFQLWVYVHSPVELYCSCAGVQLHSCQDISYHSRPNNFQCHYLSVLARL